MNLSKFFKEAIAWRQAGGHAVDHAILNVPSAHTDTTNRITGLINKDNTIQFFTRVLKNFTGVNQLTGGTINAKTLLMQVSIPDGLLLDYKASIRISGIFVFTMNTNSKTFGVDIGTSFASGTGVWSRTRSSASSGEDSLLVDLQRYSLDGTKIIMSYGSSVAIEGNPNIASSGTGTQISIDPNTTGLYLYFWGNLNTANTDSVVLNRAFVETFIAEQ